MGILQGNSGRSTAAENRKRNMVVVVVVWDSRAKDVEGVLDLGRSDLLSAPGEDYRAADPYRSLGWGSA